MKIRTLCVVSLLGLSLSVACDSKKDEKKAEDKKAESKDAKKPEEKKAEGGGGADKVDAAAKAEPAKDEPAKAEPAAAGKLALDKLGLTASAPAETTVSDGIGGKGAMIMGPGLVVSVEEASETRPKDVAAAKKDAEMYTPQNLKDEKLDDGWVVTFDNKGDMGANYFVNVRRDIAGKSIWCETTVASPEQAATALDFCKSLAAK
ncbi:MAG: hypothetical protein IPH07_37435 [Deltaproteobacteria bacterium]|nr:hypothetical protein [Deltaproteobacteria bacterium]MBK8235876.1 hypothetical protein [Deltaproteobacteria bacterium]MBK8713509.1 hypothetical protein [Deltaproteobacteria bacterium]MBP7289951.1 hypothetical protein [Nannocystaceae bacterium]